MEKPLIDQEYRLEKMDAPGGWTYVEIKEIDAPRKGPFGWVRVRGTVDGYEIRGYNLMPMGQGRLFFPVKAEIRKKIKKQLGDTVRVILYADNLPTDVPEELADCLKDEPGLYEKFMAYSEGEKKGFIEWIYSAKTDETRAARIVKTIEKVASGQKFHQQ
ncbi:YdeI/OmpD-associated family protein [Emticicia sp. TH156]|uniref:YdeI/OmpD-associated family protein n=1 Tax=Emticicia sp. TH156 TaxID=2067454 RepID=UPI000C781969|nr:YdeI/OmpD-associated family protein [Emticicia sp. TH156]PLK44766.1 hypothetical protein C0V77_09980 [Emticicia sp. TH156]